METAHSAALNSSSSRIAAQLMRDLPRKHRNALRVFYVLGDDDATVCARNGLWHWLHGANCKVRYARDFWDISRIRKPIGSASSRSGRIAHSA